MPMKNLNLDGKIGGRKCRVRKRGLSSSSPSSLYQNCRLKRVFLVSKKMGSTTPAPNWKMTISNSPSLENDDALKNLGAVKGDQRAEKLSASARKLAATLWEIDGLPSARLKGEILDEEVFEVGFFRKEQNFKCLKLGSKVLASEMMGFPKVSSHGRRASACSQKTKLTDSNLGGGKSIHGGSVENPSRNLAGTKNRLTDVHNNLVTSKELLKVMARLPRHNSTGLSLFSALKFELDRASTHVAKLIEKQKQNQTDIDTLFKRFQEEKFLWKLRQQEKIHAAVSSIASELEKEKKLRILTERLNKKLGKDLSETKELLLKTNKELGELERQSPKVCEEVEKEREMLKLSDIFREERLQMKHSEAKYQFEEKNAIVDKLSHEMEYYLKSKKGEEGENGSPCNGKIKDLKKYLLKTLPCTYKYEDKEENNIEIVNKVEDRDDDDEEDEDDCDSTDSDLHSIELNVDDVSKSFKWGEGIRNEMSRKIKKPVIECGILSSENDGENLDAFEKRGLFEFPSKPWKKEMDGEIERYNMIKDLRDHIVSGSKMVSSQDSASPSPNELGRERAVCSKD